MCPLRRIRKLPGLRSAFIAVSQDSSRNGAWGRKRILTRPMVFGATNRCSPNSTAPRFRGAWRRARAPACASREWETKWIPKTAPCHRVPAVRRLPASASMPASASPLATVCGWSGWRRYAGRPPLATERLSLLPDGRLLYRLKRRWRDGTTHVIYEPLELMERLAALVHPPRFNITRYYGMFAPAASLRPRVIPEAEASSPPRHPGCQSGVEAPASDPGKTKKKRGCQPRNYPWATLMARVFELDVLACTRCGGRMRILAAIDSPDAIQKILTCLGLPTRAPPIAPAVSDPETAYAW